MAKYRKIDPRIWNDEKFCRLSERGQLAFLYLLTHPNMTSLGAMRATLAGLASEMGWSTKTMMTAIGPAIDDGMVVVNDDANYVGLPKFLRYNEPNGPNSVTAWRDALDAIPECAEKVQLAKFCVGYMLGKSDGFLHAIGDGILNAFGMASAILDLELDLELDPKTLISSSSVDLKGKFVGLSACEKSLLTQLWRGTLCDLLNCNGDQRISAIAARVVEHVIPERLAKSAAREAQGKNDPVEWFCTTVKIRMEEDQPCPQPTP